MMQHEQDDEGNAKELSFGLEFEGEAAQFLMNDEVAALMDMWRKKYEQTGGQTNE